MEKLHAHGPYKGDNFGAHSRYVRWKVSKDKTLFRFSSSFIVVFFFVEFIIDMDMMNMKKKKNNIQQNHQMLLICLKHLGMLLHHQQILIEIKNIGKISRILNINLFNNFFFV